MIYLHLLFLSKSSKMSSMKTQFLTLPNIDRTPLGKGDMAGVLCLASREVSHALKLGRGSKIRVLSGSVWLTQSSDPLDYFLRAGETLTVSRPGTVVIQGWPDTCLQVS